MKKNFLIFLLANFSFLTFFSSYSFAEEDLFPIATSLIPEIQYPGIDTTVFSRFSWLYGRHKELYGIDIGILGNMTDKSFGGTALSLLFNINKGKVVVVGFQFAGLVNWNTGKTYVAGAQLGLVNMNKGDGGIYGVQLGAANLSEKTNIYGLQIGLYNEAATVTGFQIGLVNVAKSLRGVQLGLANINKGGIPFFPGMNIGF